MGIILRTKSSHAEADQGRSLALCTLALVPSGGSYGALLDSCSFWSLTTLARVPGEGKVASCTDTAGARVDLNRGPGTGVLMLTSGL
jgi:hypothetical protein